MNKSIQYVWFGHNPHHANYHFWLLIGNFIKAATLQEWKGHDPIHQSCSSSCSANNSCREMALGTLNNHARSSWQEVTEQWEVITMQANPACVSADLFSWVVWRCHSWEYHCITFDGWLYTTVDILHNWFHWPVADLCFTYKNEHVPIMVWTCMNYISICSVGPAKAAASPQQNPTFPFTVDTCSCSCSISAKRDCSCHFRTEANACDVDVPKMNHRTWGILGLEVATLTATN